MRSVSRAAAFLRKPALARESRQLGLYKVQCLLQTRDILVFQSIAMNPELLNSCVKYLFIHYSALCTAIQFQHFLQEDPGPSHLPSVRHNRKSSHPSGWAFHRNSATNAHKHHPHEVGASASEDPAFLEK